MVRPVHTQVSWGLDDPAWRTWSKKSRNKAKREKIEDAEREIRDYEARCNLPDGSLSGGLGARVALRALPAQNSAGPATSLVGAVAPPGGAIPGSSNLARALGGPG